MWIYYDKYLIQYFDSYLFFQCRINTLDIIWRANLNSDAKLERLEKQKAHLEEAKKQRQYYNAWRTRAKNSKTYADSTGE
jgi:hypothetical protein